MKSRTREKMKDKTGEEAFDVVFSEKEVEDLLSNESWQNDVAEAAFIGALYSNKINKSPEQMIEEIVRYNVVNKMRDFFLSRSKPLPKSVVWKKDYSLVKAFSFIENYVCRIIMMKEGNVLTKPVTIAIEIEDKNLVDYVKTLCDDFNNVYPQVQLSWKGDLTEKYKIYITAQ